LMKRKKIVNAAKRANVTLTVTVTTVTKVSSVLAVHVTYSVDESGQTERIVTLNHTTVVKTKKAQNADVKDVAPANTKTVLIVTIV